MITSDTTDKQEVCPICGAELSGYEYHEECWGSMTLTERHIYCPNCTYREEMAYSKPRRFICETEDEKYKTRAKAQDVEILTKDEYEQMG